MNDGRHAYHLIDDDLHSDEETQNNPAMKHIPAVQGDSDDELVCHMEQQTRSSAEYRDGEDEAQRNGTDIEDSRLSSDAINTLIPAKAALNADRTFHSFPSDTQVDQKNPVGPWNVSHYNSTETRHLLHSHLAVVNCRGNGSVALLPI